MHRYPGLRLSRPGGGEGPKERDIALGLGITDEPLPGVRGQEPVLLQDERLVGHVVLDRGPGEELRFIVHDGTLEAGPAETELREVPSRIMDVTPGALGIDVPIVRGLRLLSA